MSATTCRRAARPPSAPAIAGPQYADPIKVHTVRPRLPECQADTVVFLGDLHDRLTHFRTNGAGTIGCDGSPDCTFCQRERPRVNWYAPALLNLSGDVLPQTNGGPRWTRCIFHVPAHSAELFGYPVNNPGQARPPLFGKAYKVWRGAGRVQHLEAVFLRHCHRVDERAFDVDVVLSHLWWGEGNEASKAEVLAQRKDLPAVVTPPQLLTPLEQVVSLPDVLVSLVREEAKQSARDELVRLDHEKGRRLLKGHIADLAGRMSMSGDTPLSPLPKAACHNPPYSEVCDQVNQAEQAKQDQSRQGSKGGAA